MGWINGIGNFEAGEGYLVQVSQNGMLPMFESNEKSAYLVAGNLTPAYFNVDYEGNGSGHMNINIGNLYQSGLKAGDEIAAFDGKICVGAVRLSKSNLNLNVVSIAVSASDKYKPNGFTEDSPIFIKVWYGSENVEIKPIFKVNQGKMIYQKYKSVFISFADKITTETEDTQFFEYSIHPNPANKQVIIEFLRQPESDTRIFLVNMMGRYLINRKVNSAYEVLNVELLPAGIYFIQILTNDNLYVQKLLVNRF